MLDNIMTKEDLNDYNNELLSYVNAKLNKINDNIDTYHTESGNPITIKDAADVNAVDVSVDIEPIQDLHGYDHPWVGGAGKNKLPMTVDGIRSANTSGTWSGNAYTYNGVTFTIQTDNDSNVTGINADGTASSIAFFNVGVYTASAGDILNGCPAGGGNNGPYKIMGIGATTSDTGDGKVIVNEVGQEATYRIVIWSNATVTNLKFYPMIRKSTELDASFEPYTNICRIRPVTEFNMSGLFNINDPTTSFSTAVHYTYTLKPNTSYTLSTNYPGIVDEYGYIQDHLFAGADGYESPGIRQGSPKTITTSSSGQLHIYVRFNSRYYDLYNAVKQGLYCIRLEEGSIANEPSPQIDIQRVGKNLWNEDYVGITSTAIYTPVYVGNGTFTLSTTTPLYQDAACLFLLAGNVSTGGSSPTNGVSNGISRTVESVNGYVTVAYRLQATTTPVDYETQLEQGSTATTYEPYQGETYIIKTGENIYGCTLDETTGKLVVTHGIAVFDGSSDENWAVNWTGTKVYSCAAGSIPNGKIESPQTIGINGISNKYGWVTYDYGSESIWKIRTDGAEPSSAFAITYTGSVAVKDITCASVSEFTNSLASNPLQVIYELATPQTINLTPQQIKLLKGTNTLYVNSGDIEVSYWKDNVDGDIIKVLESKLDNMKDEIMTYLDSQIINGGS